MSEEIQTIEAPFIEAIKNNAGLTIIVGDVLKYKEKMIMKSTHFKRTIIVANDKPGNLTNEMSKQINIESYEDA